MFQPMILKKGGKFKVFLGEGGGGVDTGYSAKIKN